MNLANIYERERRDMVSPGATNVFKTDNHVMINCTWRQRWQRHAAAAAILLPDPPDLQKGGGEERVTAKTVWLRILMSGITSLEG